MRFLVTRAPDALARARPPVRAFLAFAVLLLLAGAAQRAARGSLAPAGVEALYDPSGQRLGSVAAWEALHAGAFLYGFLLLTLGSLLAASPARPRVRRALLAASTAGALLDLGAPLLPALRPGFPGWALLHLAGFAAATVGLLASCAVAWARFGAPGRRSDA